MSTMNEDLLLNTLQNRSPILLLGAGFSRGSITKNGSPVPMANDLTKDIFNYFYGKDKCPANLTMTS